VSLEVGEVQDSMCNEDAMAAAEEDGGRGCVDGTAVRGRSRLGGA
jgi:hypothetical protein